MCFQRVDYWKILQTWMIYVVPHFRYGALIWHTNNEETIQIKEKFNKLYNQSIKTALNISKTTPNKFLKKLLNTWEADSLIEVSYIAAANKWKRLYQKDNNLTNMRTKIENKIDKIRRELNIDQQENMNKKTILLRKNEIFQVNEENWKNCIKNNAEHIQIVRW